MDQAVYGKGIVAVSREQYSYTADGLLDCAAVRMNPAAYGGLPASSSFMPTTIAMYPSSNPPS